MLIFLIENSPPLKGKVLIECKLPFLKTLAVDGVELIFAELVEVIAVGVDVELEDKVKMVAIEESDVWLVVEVDVGVKSEDIVKMVGIKEFGEKVVVGVDEESEEIVNMVLVVEIGEEVVVEVDVGSL